MTLFYVVICSGSGFLVFSDSSPLNRVSYLDSARPRKKVVVLGTGWAATSFLKNLKSSNYDVEVVSPRNYFAFTPLLPSVTNGTVEARSIVEPIRKIISKVKYCNYLCCEIWFPYDARNLVKT